MRLIGLQITLAILLPFLLLLLIRVRVIFSYRDDVRVHLAILFLRFPLYPRKKRVKVSKYTYRKHRKRLLAQRAKVKKAEASPPPPKRKPPSLRAQIRFYTSLIKRHYAHFLRHFRIDLARLHIRVATGDAATTAILCGVVSQAVAYLLEFLSLHTNLHTKRAADVAVTPDFLAEQSKADCKIVFSLRVYAILSLGIRFFHHLLTDKMKNLRTTQNKEDASCLKTN